MKIIITKPCYSALIDPEYSLKPRVGDRSAPYEESITVRAFAALDMAHKAIQVEGNSHDVEMSEATAEALIGSLRDALDALRAAKGGAQ